ncbi:MAG: hypothetical protein ACXABY_06075 [Candidatus Thorarchaeota archaeon]|jgi:hypothetical protein
MNTSFSPQQLEDGIVYFHGVGKCAVSWWYRDHNILCIMSNEYNTFGVDEEMGLQVFFEGTDITDKYLEGMYEASKVRSSIPNIARILMLIDENMDNYIADSLKEKEGSE